MPSRSIWERYKLFIFDADDTLRRTTAPGKPCPHSPEEWVLIPGVRDRLRQVPWGSAGGPLFGIASNQDHVGYGHLTLTMARNLLRDLAHAAADCRPPDAVLQLCPHRLDQECGCRKPQPGMLLAIMSFYGVSANETLFVGNHEVDREAAARARTGFSWSSSFFRQPA